MRADQRRASVDYASGHCVDCGRYTPRGRILGSIDQGSGPGYTPVVCAVCDPQPDGPPAAGHPTQG